METVSVMLMTLKHQSSPKRKLLAAARAASAHLPHAIPPVLFLTDPARTPDPVRTAESLPPGWGIIYRHFGAPDAGMIAADLAHVCRARKLRLLISADPVLAMAVGAAGVHWPHARLASSRKWRGAFALMTASSHSPAELRAIAHYPIDAALVSAVFPSNSPSAGKPLGALKLQQLVRSAPCPVFALGGVTAENAGRVSGFSGVAAVGSLSRTK
jgi:thiamine-phosphate pyrophosphorylase